MKMLQALVKILIMSATLAAYELFFKGLYYGYLESIGQTGAFGMVMLGYMIPLVFGYVLSSLIIRRLKSE